MTVRTKQNIRTKKKTALKRAKKNRVPRRVKSFRPSKLAILEKSGLIGCLTETGVTSTNYKDILYKE